MRILRVSVLLALVLLVPAGPRVEAAEAAGDPMAEVTSPLPSRAALNLLPRLVTN